MKKLVLLLSILYAHQIFALDLISFPFGDKQMTYSIVQRYQCSFKDVKGISAPIIEKEQGFNLPKLLNYFQQKLNLEIDKKNITDERIQFSLKGSHNVYFEFFYKDVLDPITKKKYCQLIRTIRLNDQSYNLEHVKLDIRYKDSLNSYVLDKIIIYDKEDSKKDLYIYPWSLQGQISSYEFNLGMAINLQSNFRNKNRTLFYRQNPVVEPIPAFFFRYGPLFLNKNGLGSLVYNHNDLSILAMALLEGEPYRAVDLRDRKRGVFLGSIVKWDFLEFTYYNDFFTDKGHTFKLNLAPVWTYKLNWKISPQAFIQYWSDQYMDYYFAVTPSEALVSQYPLYNPRPDLNYGINIEFTHFVRRWTLGLNLGAKFYGKEVTNSPTVNKNVEFRSTFGILYKIF